MEVEANQRDPRMAFTTRMIALDQEPTSRRIAHDPFGRFRKRRLDKTGKVRKMAIDYACHQN